MKKNNINGTIRSPKPKEGDIWTENGKTWTIKNGIRMTVSEKDTLRASLLLPLSCPKCSGPMNTHLDEKMWHIHKKCFDCVIREETKMRLNGTYEQYERNIIYGNIVSTLNDVKDEMQEFIKQNTADQFVTEDGTVESWVDDSSLAKEKVLTQIDKTDTLIGEFLNERNT